MTDIAITSLLAAPYERRQVGDVAALANSIREIGLMNPITVQAIPEMPGQFRLLAGAHRVEAAKRLGWATIPARVVDLDDLRAEMAIIDENLLRNELTVLERGEQMARRKEIHEALHPETKHGSKEQMKAVRRGEMISSRQDSFATDTASKANVSTRTVQQEVQIAERIAPAVKDVIRDTPLADSKTELLQLARMDHDKQVAIARKIEDGAAADLRTAVTLVRQDEQVAAAAEQTSAPASAPTWPTGRYPIIYADPPWKYNDRSNPNTKYGGGCAAHYSTMSVEEICALPVRSLATDDAYLFLWVTWPTLPDGIRVMEAWGFAFITCAFNWIKLNEDGSPFFGIGYYTKSNSEVCLLGRRGSPWKVSDGVAQVVMSRRQEHSRKPEEVRERIVRLCGDRPRIELFSRQAAPGWHAWGNQTDRFDGQLPVQDAPEATLDDLCSLHEAPSKRERSPKKRVFLVHTMKLRNRDAKEPGPHTFRESARTPDEAAARIASLPLVVEVLDVRPVEEVPS